jgi:hypothetical protein
MRALSLVVGGFLAAVLWLDLMFDVQVAGQTGGTLNDASLASMAGYYQRIVVDASPMGRMVGLVMLVGWVSVGLQLKRRELEGVLGWITATALLAPTLLAMVRIVPNAARLGARADSIEVQSALARSIYVEHLACLGAIALFIALQLASQRRKRAVHT